MVVSLCNGSTNMKAFELGRLEPYSRLHAQQLMDLVKRCKELNIAAGRRFEVRNQATRGQCFLVEGSVQICSADRLRLKVWEEFDHRHPRARQPLLPDNSTGRYVLTRSRSRIVVVDSEINAGAGNLSVTPIGSSDESAWMRTFLGGSLTAQLTPRALRDLFREFEPEQVSEGQIIGKIGEHSARFHVIKRGQVRILDRVTLAVLGPGEFFGEDSLIRGRTRNATIASLTDGELLWIHAEAFRRLLRSSFVRDLRTGMAAVRVNLVSASHAPSDSAHLNLETSALRDSLHLFNPETRYLLLGERGDVELGAFILTHHGYDAYAQVSDGHATRVGEAGQDNLNC